MAVGALARLALSTLAATWLALSAASPVAAEEASSRTVLTVYWSSDSFGGTHELNSAIQDALRPHPERIDYFAEYLESDRFRDEDISMALRDYIRRKYRDRKIDVVIAITDVALEFVLRYRADLFPDAPIVSSTVRPPDASIRNSGPGLAGMLYGIGFAETLKLASTLHPSAKRVYYIAGAPDPMLRESMRAQLRGIAPQVELVDITETSMPAMIAAVKAVPAGNLIFYIRYSEDDPGNVRSPSEIAPLVAGASTVPVYGVDDLYLGSGIVGGVMVSRRQIGTRIGEMARRILEGARPQDMPIEEGPLVPMFDWRQLRRWGIAERAVPAQSVMQFREVPAWERYRTAITVTLAVILLQSALIVTLIFERKRRRRAEIESRLNLTAMAHLDRRAAMGELATSLAHELSQPLNAILQNAGVAQMLLKSNPVPPARATARCDSL